MNIRTAIKGGHHLLFFLLVIGGPAWADDHSRLQRLVVFGTSLSDPGNAYALFYPARPLSRPPYDMLDDLLIPDMPYARKGGFHFSNGPTWVEQYGRTHGLARSVRAAYDTRNHGASNYAVRGARATDQPEQVDLPDQVERFLGDFERNGRIPEDAIYVVEIGANDVRDALNLAPGSDEQKQMIAAALNSIAGTMQRLYGLGARRFLVLNVGNIGLTPALDFLNLLQPGAAAGATALTAAFNQNLENALTSLEALPGIDIAVLDAFTKVTDVHNHPHDYEIANAHDACVSKVAPYTCRHHNNYLFWDGIHISEATHGIIAQEAAELLAADKSHSHHHGMAH